MALQIGDTAPDFEAETTEGRIRFHDCIGDSWAVLFSHPKDFTPVCTTELGYMAKAKPEFDRRNVKIIGLSVDPVDNHAKWASDIEETQGHAPNYPIIADDDFNVSKLFGMLGADVSGDPADRTAADNQTVRNVFVVGPDKKIKPDFDRRNVKIIGLSVDPVDKHGLWSKDIEETQGTAPNYPMIADTDFHVSKLYGMLGADVSGDPADRTAADNETVRNVFVIGPDKKVKLILVYPMTTGRNFDEVLRVIDSLQLTAKHKVSTPVNWKDGDDVIIAGSVSDEAAKEIWPDGWESPKPYIRIVQQPR